MEAGLYDKTLIRLYGRGPNTLEKQRARYAEAARAFGERYGGDLDVSIYSVPGRSELCGNHTDHNAGVAVAAAVDLDIVAVVSKSHGNMVRMRSDGEKHEMRVNLSDTAPVSREIGKSAAMIRGVAAGFKMRRGRIGGFKAYVTSNVLKGSGLSSSAAFEVCIGAIFNGEYNRGRFSPIELGIIGQYAENEYFGKPSGLMDQVACAVGGVMSIDFKDAANPVVAKAPFDLTRYGYRMTVTDTKGSHSNLTNEYALIRSEMEAVALLFHKPNLREVNRDLFISRIGRVRAKTGDRAVLRAMHFFEECRRARELFEAAERGDIKRFLSLIQESGHSSFEYNQNAYLAGKPGRQGISLALALSQLILNERGAWRLQGGGFAGTIQAFVPEDLLAPYRSLMHDVFGEGTCNVLSFREDGPLRVTRH